MFTDIKELEKYLINDQLIYSYYMHRHSKIHIDFDSSKIIWGCCIYEYNKKVGMNYIFPLMIYHNLKNGYYILFDIDFTFNDDYHYVDKAREKYKIAQSHIRNSSELLWYSELHILDTNKIKDLSDFEIKLFDNAGNAEQYRKETEKKLRKQIKEDKEVDSNNMISLEAIANKFNIDINKLIIKGIWNDPYNKKRKMV